MARICPYFQLHQPYRLAPFSVFDLNQENAEYFRAHDHDQNRAVFQKVANKSYLPMLSLLLRLVQNVPSFVCSLSCSGIFLEQAAQFEPQVIELIDTLVQTDRVELLAETYYHSLASMYSPAEFAQQVLLHTKLVHDLFSATPTTFRNTELIYSNQIAHDVANLGFEAILADGVSRYLGNRRPTQVFASASEPRIPVLLKHAQLSDDIAFRFSNKDWASFPLTAEKYIAWLESYYEDELINLFMDFETFGEHQWSDTGIFSFFEAMVYQSADHPKLNFVQPREAVASFVANPALLELQPVYDVPIPISWADIDRDLTAWQGNDLQRDTLRLIYSLEDAVLSSHDQTLIHNWRRLQTSDHFYYMCIKWSADGDVHKYFSPYDSPFEAYNRYTAVVADFVARL